METSCFFLFSDQKNERTIISDETPECLTFLDRRLSNLIILLFVASVQTT